MNIHFLTIALFLLYWLWLSNIFSIFSSSTSRTGSSAGVELRNGRLVAITHNIPKTGYKAPNSYGAKPRFCGETTSRTTQKACFVSESSSQTPTSSTKKASYEKKPLQKYHPFAPRNRPKQFTTNNVGKRFGFTNKANKTETYRGSSQVTFGDQFGRDSSAKWKTTNQVYMKCASRLQNKSGMENQGIASDVARRLHNEILPKLQLETTF